ncbi:hypothetical protein HDU92_004229 [Lobulomyces angularis]|nr:hypothetical protein HDU92_004229 [Lobulomyces angularis]
MKTLDLKQKIQIDFLNSNFLNQKAIVFPIFLFCRNFLFLRLMFYNENEQIELHQRLQNLINIESVQQLYAFSYAPEDVSITNEGLLSSTSSSFSGWDVYDPIKEFKRMNLPNNWRISNINKNYEFVPTYPEIIAVPSKISDTVLRHIGSFRSKGRIPALSYLHRTNNCSITRCSQPMVGLKQNRNIQDEKLVENIFSASQKVPKNNSHNFIIDARPLANAMGQMALGAGTENTDYYRGCKLFYSGIDNIHVVRDAQNKLIEALQTIVDGPVSKAQLDKSGWLKHIRHILTATLQIVQGVHLNDSSVLVHCSDGWDRTAQLSSLAQICLDPYFRTIEGFEVLIEKEWLSFGFKFSDRCGHLSRPTGGQSGENTASHPSFLSQLETGGNKVGKFFSLGLKSFMSQLNSSASDPELNLSVSSHKSASEFNQNKKKLETLEFTRQNSLTPKEISPIFTQFLDCLYQLFIQFPQEFEFNEQFLIDLNDNLYSGKFGTFLFNSEKERMQFTLGENNLKIQNLTKSFWEYVHVNKKNYLNQIFILEQEMKLKNFKGKNKETNSYLELNSDALNSEIGKAGSIDKIYNVLFPTTDNLKYWSGLFFRLDFNLDKCESDEDLTDFCKTDIIKNSTVSNKEKNLKLLIDENENEEMQKSLALGLKDQFGFVASGVLKGLNGLVTAMEYNLDDEDYQTSDPSKDLSTEFISDEVIGEETIIKKLEMYDLNSLIEDEYSSPASQFNSTSLKISANERMDSSKICASSISDPLHDTDDRFKLIDSTDALNELDEIQKKLQKKNEVNSLNDENNLIDAFPSPLNHYTLCDEDIMRQNSELQEKNNKGEINTRIEVNLINDNPWNTVNVGDTLNNSNLCMNNKEWHPLD